MPPPKGRGRIGNGVRIPDRTAAVMPSDALYAIGSNPRRLRDALRLSQKTCLRSAYRIFGLKRDMFLKRARLRDCPWAGCACDAESIAGYIGAGRCVPRFFCSFAGKPLFSRWSAHWRRARRRRLVPDGSAMRFPAAGGECRPRWPQAARPSPLGAGAASASPGTGV